MDLISGRAETIIKFWLGDMRFSITDSILDLFSFLTISPFDHTLSLTERCYKISSFSTTPSYDSGILAFFFFNSVWYLQVIISDSHLLSFSDFLVLE